MRRKARPDKWRRIKKLHIDMKEGQSQTYAISGEAQTALSAVIESMLEECLVDAKNLATMAGKSYVTPEEMENALRKLCLRLNAQPSMLSKQKVNTQQREDLN
ncbi:PREDICTED: uncharacterized protein LOC108750536 isoform X2 [Trachymyrmex septentrionalis]|uniref:uncharacterized protein LOC108750536 isoform X2 n=1 Tax=Trachymyrmex septentrionalis TaxID=34720 RepID=UPI00084F1C24|nr:PREDICTED: uncharacterized protein LOC108750536 isoform X2 [Trachymyrmex septentrionalis]